MYRSCRGVSSIFMVWMLPSAVSRCNPQPERETESRNLLGRAAARREAKGIRFGVGVVSELAAGLIWLRSAGVSIADYPQRLAFGSARAFSQMNR